MGACAALCAGVTGRTQADPTIFIWRGAPCYLIEAVSAPVRGRAGAEARGMGAGGVGLPAPRVGACVALCAGVAGRMQADPGYSMGAERLAIFSGAYAPAEIIFPFGKARALRGAGYAVLGKRSIFPLFPLLILIEREAFPLGGRLAEIETTPPSP